ncbi:hypothetical protein ILUMI_21788 [Ignelater luminosus]|uniref:Kinesin-like protein n=1 Tax=Ignelater luminosus TaxID=2038154 RepID=A0A8K0CBU5_IGNLU|nr:hypothetical protein ILUMI_21788 [Ignelater luminosus]
MAKNKTSRQDEIENVRVVIRVRPLSKKEQTEGYQNIVVVDRTENVIILSKPGTLNEKSKSFKFDYIFPEDSTQMDLYRHIALPIVEKAFQGYNGTIFAYGQTGTGKTYTMSGIPNQNDLKGIIPNTFSHIFTQISRASGERSFVVTVTYLEIYNEDVRDLLSSNPNAKLEVRERPDVGVYVKDLMGFTVDSIESITELMNRGNANRMTRSTLMNDVSSRSHAIFTLTIEAKDRVDNKTTIGKLNLVDLAGSERLSRTHATGDRLKEASNINQSLSVLGNVISALVEGKSSHIPYRNSKLTRLLQDSLGGNSKTAMIAMVSPCEIDFEESICTLRYASRAKYIKNHVRVNVETKKGLIESFEQEIAELQKRVAEISMEEEKVIEVEFVMINVNRKEKTELLQKISVIQKKILVGGENLFEKAQQQQFLLETSVAEIENLNRSQQQLEETLQKKGAERINVEEKYSSLQEEDIALTKKIKKVQALLNEVKEEHADKEHEYQREMQALLDTNRLIVREIQLANVMIEYYIPKEYLRKIETNTQWNQDTTEYQMRGVAYTGNNMRKNMSANSEKEKPIRPTMKSVYHSYNTTKSKQRARTSWVPRPSGHRQSGCRSARVN